jgi:hypothetical protein
MHHSDHSFRPLLLSLSRDLRLLLDQTAGLARAEIQTAVRSTVFYLAIAGGGVVTAIGGLLVLLSAFVLIAIALGLPPWAAATVVALLMIGAGAAANCGTSNSICDIHEAA